MDKSLFVACTFFSTNKSPTLSSPLFDNEISRSYWSGHKTSKDPQIPQQPISLILSDLTEPTIVTSDWIGKQITPGKVLAPTGAKGLLVNMMSLPSQHDEELNEWYNSEHIPRIAEVDGVLSARRFKVVQGNIDYAAIYHLEDVTLVKTIAWAEAATTPWTKRIQELRIAGSRYLFETNEEYQ